jgi:hypothetical protein
MNTTIDGPFFQEGDQVRLKRTGETGQVKANDGCVTSMRIDTTNESRNRNAFVAGDAAIELVTIANSTDEQRSLPFSAQQSEQWLLERTYHAQLRNGKELSVANFTEAMEQLSDFDVPPSFQSAKSKLPEIVPVKKSSTFAVPISTWKEITPGEARVTYQQGKPILLYGEHTWKQSKTSSRMWRTNRNMRSIISGNDWIPPEDNTGTNYAVCYLSTGQGTFSNVAWKNWFSTDTALLFEAHDQAIIFFGACVQFPFTTHYTVVAANGDVSEYPDHASALQGFITIPLPEENTGAAAQTVIPHFCYYHEVLCPSGVYRLEFFGPRMDERGYRVAMIS